MLERTRGSRHGGHFDPDRATSTEEFLNYADIARFFTRYWLTIALAILLSVTAAGFHVFSTQPSFTARAQLLIDPHTPAVLHEQLGTTTLSLDSPQVESQIAVLRSEDLAATVVKSLDLVNDREFQPKMPSAIELKLKSLLKTLKSILSSQLTAGEATPAAHTDDVAEHAADDIPLRIAIQLLLGRLDVRRVGMSYAIDVSFTSIDPAKAALVANTFAEAYVADQLATRARAVRQGSSWLEERIEQIRLQMNEANLRVQEFKAKRDYRIFNRRDDASPPDLQSAAQTDTALPHREINTLEALESTAQTYRKIYETFLQAFTEAVQRQSFPVASARIITRAAEPLSKSHPKTKLVLAFGVLLGAMTGFGIALVRGSLDRSVRSPRQIRQELGMECLGQVPRLSRRAVRRGFAVPREAPFCRFSDEMKKVKTAISQAKKAQEIRSLGITSALPGEGKSTFASNLGHLFSSSGMRTLIVDADLRNSTLTRSLAAGAKSGLVELLQGSATPEQCIVHLGSGLDMVPAATRLRVPNSSDLLGSENMRLLLGNLTEAYDLVVLDLPPLNALADGIAVSPLLNAVVLVAEWGETPLQLLEETSHMLSAAQANLLGVVITKVDPKTVDQHTRASRSYYY